MGLLKIYIYFLKQEWEITSHVDCFTMLNKGYTSQQDRYELSLDIASNLASANKSLWQHEYSDIQNGRPIQS